MNAHNNNTSATTTKPGDYCVVSRCDESIHTLYEDYILHRVIEVLSKRHYSTYAFELNEGARDRYAKYNAQRVEARNKARA